MTNPAIEETVTIERRRLSGAEDALGFVEEFLLKVTAWEGSDEDEWHEAREALDEAFTAISQLEQEEG